MRNKKLLKFKKKCKMEIKGLERLVKFAEIRGYESLRVCAKQSILDRKLFLCRFNNLRK